MRRPGVRGPVVPADADRTFRRLLVNSLVSGVTSSFLWFALTFWVYLETRSVVVDRRHRRRLQHLGGDPRTGLRHLRRPSPQAAVDGPRDDDHGARLHRRHGGVRGRPGRGPAAAAQPAVLGDGRPHPARLGRRPDAQHRDVDVRDAARPRGPPRPRQRHGRHGHRRVVRRSRRCSAASSSATSAWAGRFYVSVVLTVAALVHLRRIHVEEPEPVPAADGSVVAHRRPRRAGGDPGRPRADAAGAARRVQQPARRRLHGADGRLRAVDRVRADVGAAVRRRQLGVHHRRPRRRQGRARLAPGAHRARRQPRQLDRLRHVHAALVDRAAGASACSSGC